MCLNTMETKGAKRSSVPISAGGRVPNFLPKRDAIFTGISAAQKAFTQKASVFMFPKQLWILSVF